MTVLSREIYEILHNFIVQLIMWTIPSVIRQKGESQNGCFKKSKAKFSERTFLTP